jgi:hypothetical protein
VKLEVEIDCRTVADEVEQQADLDFFRELPDTGENTLGADYEPEKFVFGPRC